MIIIRSHITIPWFLSSIFVWIIEVSYFIKLNKQSLRLLCLFLRRLCDAIYFDYKHVIRHSLIWRRGDFIQNWCVPKAHASCDSAGKISSCVPPVMLISSSVTTGREREVRTGFWSSLDRHGVNTASVRHLFDLCFVFRVPLLLLFAHLWNVSQHVFVVWRISIW